MNAHIVRAACFEAARVDRGLPVHAVVIVMIFDHMPAKLGQVNLFATFRFAVKQRHALRRQHPLVAVGHDEIRATGLNVERQRAQGLNRIDTKEHV